LLVALGLGAWLLLTQLDDLPNDTMAAAGVEPTAPRAAARLDQAAAAAPQAPAAGPQLAVAHEHAENEQARDLEYDPARHPHPLTDERARIHHENNLIQGLNDAMDSQDPDSLRQVLADYRRSHPEDPHRLQEGYALIADCLDDPGPASRVVGERYMKENRASTLRRFVERHCVKTAPRFAQAY
jgi:hypothetical protein